MADVRLERVTPVSTATAAVSWGESGRKGRRGSPKREPGGNRERLIRMLAPGHAPEALELEYVVDRDGMMVAIQVRDLRNGEVVARIRAEDLWRLASEDAAGGLLLERRG